MPPLQEAIEAVGLAIDAVGVLVIIAGLVFAVGRFAFQRSTADQPFRRLRQDIGKGILLGLEFLVAADIVRTVALAPTFENVRVLALIVLVRTFLSMALQVELEGHWPWQRSRASGTPGDREA
jgi:uncharacterized membrane protein